MPKRTRRQAILRCRKLWAWLAESGSGSKTEAYRALKLKLNDDLSCPACEYCYHSINNLCGNDCIIPWPSPHGGCAAYPSPYFNWESARGPLYQDLRKLYASQIVTLCDKALKALPKCKTRRTKK
jgi:hypothetical protein